jgi:hypothetical protein
MLRLSEFAVQPTEAGHTSDLADVTMSEGVSLPLQDICY